MEEIKIKLLEETDTEQLYYFELENRSFFEKSGLARGESYYDFNNFKGILKEILAEQEEGLVYMYLVLNNADQIVGRVNLVSVIRGRLNKAELGYRIGEAHQGKGYGTEAVRLILGEAADTYNLHRLEAGTSPDNIGSQVVLVKNGFQFTGRYNKYIYQNGKWEDSISFEKILD